MKRLSPQCRNKILANTIPWMEGKITTYEVAKRAGCVWHSAQKYLPIYAEMIKKKEIEIVDKLTKIDDSQDKCTIWQKIKTRILSSILTAPSAIPTPK